MPFGPNCEWANMDACIAANQDKDDPSGWCATVMRETEEHCKEKDEAESKAMTIPNISKTLVPYSATPPAPRARAWNARAALKRARAWAGEDSTKYRRMFVRLDADGDEHFSGPHHDIIDGEPHTVFQGVAALAVVLSAGDASWPEDIAGSKAHTEKHYKAFDEKAPWQRNEKDFTWLPEEKRAAKVMSIDLAEAQKALFAADGTGVAKDGCSCHDGGNTMTAEHVLIIRNDADVSEEIETPADGVFEEDVAAVSLDGGETWLELEDGRVKEEADPDPTSEGDGDDDDPDAEDAEAEAERTRLAEEAAAAQAEADAAAAAEAEAEADKNAKPDLILDHSLLGELAETGYMRYLWNLTYALCDVLCGLIDEDDMTVAEKNAKATKALSEFNGLAKSSFSEAVNLIASGDAEPEPEDNPFAGMSFADIVRNALAEGTGLDDNAEASEDTATEMTALLTQVAELKTVRDGKDTELTEAVKLIDELLDMPLARKITDDDGDDTVDIDEKYPWLDPSLRRKLAARRE